MVQIAHELRNIFAIILGNCELANEDPQQRHFSRIKSAIHRGVALLESVSVADEGVDFSQPLDLNAVITEASELLRSALVPTDRVRLVLDLAPRIPMVAGNSLWLFSSLCNICFNARDAMKGTGGELKLSTFVRNTSAIIAIADTGRGMTKAQLQNLWNPQMRIGDRHGHGLQIVRVTIERMRGEISVQSKLGAGTTFTITLPALRSNHNH